ncbi:MAG: hypothetical protein AAFN10_03155 [Bacteroidota bacterium]
MKRKRIILLGAFLFTLGLLQAQRLQKGLSIGLPVLGYFDPLDIYYNRIASSRALFDDVLQIAPSYSLTYAFKAKGRKQNYLKQSAFVIPYRSTENPWDYPSYFIRLGFGRTYYLPFAPAWQWQWELGGQVDRLWKRVDYTANNPNAYAQWRKPLPYVSVNLQTTGLGKHLIAGVGIELAARGNSGVLIENAYMVAHLAWAVKAREGDPVFEHPSLNDSAKKIYIGYQQARYGEWYYYGEDHLADMRSILGEYWWGFQKQWRLASRLGVGFSVTGRGANIGIDYDWLVHVEQNAYLRIGKHLPILPFGGVGVLTGQVWQEDYELNRRVSTRKNLFRPYLKAGFRIQAPHHRVFTEFSLSTIKSFQAGVGVRLGR